MRIPVLILLLGAVCTAAASDPEKRVDEIFLPSAGGKVPGAAIAVLRDGHIVLMKAYGMANVAQGIPNSRSTIFRLASVTKSFTAIAVLQLVEAGRLKLGDPLSAYVRDFPNAERIRISHLLSHTAGVPDFIPYDEAKKRPLEFEPGTRINYSNNGYQVLGRVIESVSGEPWDAYLRDHIFAPLGMKHTGYDRTEELAGRATGYLFKGGTYEPIPDQDARAAYAAGGLYSTIEDMARFEQGLVSGQLLAPKTLEQASTANVLPDGRKTAYGYGWMTSNYRGLREVGHGGDITGFNTYIARYPDEKFAVIVLSNTGMRPAGALPDAGDLAHRIAAIWLADRMQGPDARPDVRIPPATLDLYVGRYKMDAPDAVVQAMGAYIVVTREGARLMAEANGTKLPLDARSETVFQAQGSPAELMFVRDGAARCTNLVISLMGLREFRAVRVEP